MSHKFLSDEWFEAVETLKKETAELEIPAMLQDLTINLTVSGDSEVELCLSNGLLKKAHDAEGAATMFLPADYAYRIFIENDQSAGMAGFMEGAIRVEGDMTRLMSLQTVQPTDSLVALQSKIKEMTEL